MQVRQELSNGWKHVLVAIVYGVAMWSIRQFNVPHFMMLCGFHVAALLLIPYRYWPAMIMGEFVSQVPMAIECASSFGVVWSVLMTVPMICFTAPVLYYFRKHQWIVDRRGQVNIMMLLICALLVTVVSSTEDRLLLATVVYPKGVAPFHYFHITLQWLLGNFLGILTVVPSILVLRQTMMEHGWRNALGSLFESRAVFESACVGVSVLVLLLWAGFTLPNARAVIQILMFLPVVMLSIRHGWQGAALGGTVASMGVALLMPEHYDMATIEAEVVVAFAISSMLLMGWRIGALDRHAERQQQETRTALALAQRNVHLGEMQLRMTAQAVEQARETVRAGYAMMLGRLQHLQPAIDDGGYQRVAAAAQDQLFGIADSIQPVVWRDRGLPAALREGAVARMLDRAGIRYWCELNGPLSTLSSTIHLAIYRSVCEAIAEGCRARDVSDVCVRLRGGRSRGRPWVVVSVLFRAHPVRLAHVHWEELLPRLVRTTSGVGLKAVNDRAATFEGYARKREWTGGRSIGWLMLDL